MEDLDTCEIYRKMPNADLKIFARNKHGLVKILLNCIDSSKCELKLSIDIDENELSDVILFLQNQKRKP